jgi:hypothetical protein
MVLGCQRCRSDRRRRADRARHQAYRRRALNTDKTIHYKVFDAGAIAGKPVAQKATCWKTDVKK